MANETRKLTARELSFCETITASAISPWHIRALSAKGRKLGGGTDTPAFCGRAVAWDLEVPVDENNQRCCAACADGLRAIRRKLKEGHG